MRNLYLIFIRSVFTCGIIPWSFPVKIWYFPISMSRSKTRSVIVFCLQPNMMWKSHCYSVWNWYESSFVHQAISLAFLVSPKSCVILFHLHGYKQYNVESLLIFSSTQKCPVGSSLYNSLYWNNLRHEAFAVLKISNISLISVSILSSLLYVSKHLGISLFLTRHECIPFGPFSTDISTLGHH